MENKKTEAKYLNEFDIRKGEVFNPSDYFKQYHHYEKRDETKEYSCESFDADYGRGKRKYRYHEKRVVIIDEKGRRPERWTLVEEILSKEELAILRPYCPCSMCRGEYEWWIVMGACQGCLGFDYGTQETIDEARAFREKLGGKLPPRLPRFYLYLAIKILIYGSIILIALLALIFAPRNK